MGREQEPGPQHGGVQAALPLAVRCASRETGPTDLPQTCCAAAEGQLLQDPREIDITCPSRLRELGRRSQDMPRFATARLDPHPFFFFFSPRLPLVAASKRSAYRCAPAARAPQGAAARARTPTVALTVTGELPRALRARLAATLPRPPKHSSFLQRTALRSANLAAASITEK